MDHSFLIKSRKIDSLNLTFLKNFNSLFYFSTLKYQIYDYEYGDENNRKFYFQGQN